MPYNDISPPPRSKGAPPRRRPPAVEINVRGVHVRIDRLRRPPFWLLALLAMLSGAAAGTWHLMIR